MKMILKVLIILIPSIRLPQPLLSCLLSISCRHQLKPWLMISQDQADKQAPPQYNKFHLASDRLPVNNCHLSKPKELWEFLNLSQKMQFNSFQLAIMTMRVSSACRPKAKLKSSRRRSRRSKRPCSSFLMTNLISTSD